MLNTQQSRTRRAFLIKSAAAGGTLLGLLVACTAPAPTANPAPPKPTSAAPAAPTTAPVATQVAAPAQPSTPAAAQTTAPAVLPSGPIALTAWFHDPLYVKFLKDRYPAWAEQNKVNLTIDVVQVPIDNLMTKYLGTIVAGSGAPDIIGVTNTDGTRLWKEGLVEKALLNIEPRIKDIKDQFSPARWGLYTWKGAIYGCPSHMGTSVFYYRKDVFDQLGLKGDIATMDDYMTIANRLKEQGKFIGSQDVAPVNGPWEWYIWFVQHGGQVFDKDGQLALDSGDHAVAVTEQYAKMVSDKLVVPLSKDSFAARAAAFKDNTLVASIGADWFSDYILKASAPEQKGLWDVAPLPAWANNPLRTSPFGGTGWAVSLQSKYVDVAWEVVKFAYLTYENQILRWQLIHYFPNMVKAWSDPRITQDEDPYYASKAFAGLLAKLSPSIPTIYNHAYTNEADQIIATDIVTPVLQGKKTSEQAVKDGANKLRDMISKNK